MSLQGLAESACDEPENARFVPVEMPYGKFEKAQYLEILLYIVGDNVFYCYYERVAERRMWFFFIRHFGAKEVTLSKT